MQANQPGIPQAQSYCHGFLRGTCKKGDACLFFHATQQEADKIDAARTRYRSCVATRMQAAQGKSQEE